MADRSIGLLPEAAGLFDESLLAVEQQGVAMKLPGALFKQFARESVDIYAQNAAQSAQNAEDSAQSARNDAQNAAQSAEASRQYAARPPVIRGGTWHIWDADGGDYADTGEPARGSVQYATFAIDAALGNLTMNTPDGYTGPVFSLKNGILEVTV